MAPAPVPTQIPNLSDCRSRPVSVHLFKQNSGGTSHDRPVSYPAWGCGPDRANPDWDAQHRDQDAAWFRPKYKCWIALTTYPFRPTTCSRECPYSAIAAFPFFWTERVCSNNMSNPDIGKWTFISPTTPTAKRTGERTATLQCPSGFSPYPAAKRTLNCSDHVRWPERASRPICGELLLNR